MCREDSNGNKGPAKDHYLYHILHSAPSHLYTSSVFRQTMQTYVNYDGNAYAKIHRNGNGQIAGFEIVDSRLVMPVIEDDVLLYKISGNPMVFFSDEILHIPNISFDGIQGINPIKAHRETLGLGLAAVSYGSHFFKKGAHIAGAIKTDKILTPEQKDQLRQQIMMKYEGTENAGSTILLDAGMDYKPIGISPQDAMFIETRDQQVKEVARIFGVPLHMLQSMEQSTYRNVEQQNIEFNQNTIYPFIKRWEQELNRKCFSEAERQAGYFVRFNMEGLQRADTETRAKFYQVMYNLNALTANEIRKMENKNPLPEGHTNPPMASNAKSIVESENTDNNE